MAMRATTWPVAGGYKNNHIFKIQDPQFPINYTTFIWLRFGAVYLRPLPIVKRFQAENMRF